MSHELHKKHRPKTFKEVIGQKDAIRVLTEFIAQRKVPHAILFSGPSGCGKTTLARIMKSKLECSDADFRELDNATLRGIDTIRAVAQTVPLAPVGGKCRIWLFDEFHQATKDSQSSLLKLFEDTPNHCYFMLATTDPAKLLTTLRSRCTEIKLRSVPQPLLKAHLKEIAAKEQLTFSDEVYERIIESAEGSVRQALVKLNAIVGIKDESGQLDAISRSDSRKNAIDLVKLLTGRKAPTWKSVATLLKQMDDEPEQVRRQILGYCNAVALNSPENLDKLIRVMFYMEKNFYDSGKAGLTLACHQIISAD